MPELPEVETIKSDLCKNLIGKKITGVNFIWSGILKGSGPEKFTKTVKGKKVAGIERRAKNLTIILEGNVYLLLHMKMTGHLIYTDDCWKVSNKGRWIHQNGKDSPLYDPLNQYIRVIFSLSGGKILAFSDLRKFAYLKLVTKEQLDSIYSKYGPEPLGKDLNTDYLERSLTKKNIGIKKAIMDQAVISGIGNIYADEILWTAKIHPLRKANSLSKKEIESLYLATIKILGKAIKLRGTSTSDFRDTTGKKGGFGNELSVYRRTGLPCPRDGEPIERIVVGGRGTHFCPKEQKLK